MNENVERTLNEEPKERTLMKEHEERTQKAHKNAKALKELKVAWNENDEYHPPIDKYWLYPAAAALRHSPLLHFCSSSTDFASTGLVGSSTSFVMASYFATYRLLGKMSSDEKDERERSDTGEV